MVQCLHDHDVIDQPFYKNAKVGDVVFIYVAAPFGQFLYQMEITEIFSSFDDDRVNKGRWAKYAGRGANPRKGQWVRMKFVDYANPGYKELQPQILSLNDIKTAGVIYPLSKMKASYILRHFTLSKDC